MQQEQFILPPGVTVRSLAGDRYVIESLLGKGEIGAVYLVRDRNSKKNVFALKEVINPNQQDRERFVFEGEVLKRLRHKSLPRVYRVFENNKLKRVYILMDYIPGRNLEDLRKEEMDDRFSLRLVLMLMEPVVDALIYLHNQKPPVIHRDIKPANVIIPVDAEEAMLVDFGSAKEYIAEGSVTVAARRSPGYAAPEQYGSGTGPRTDIYGLGATIYTLLTGVVPVDAITRLTRTWDKRSDPLKPVDHLVSTMPVSVAQALHRAMSINSADRFATIEEFWHVLTAHSDPDQHQEHIPRVTASDVPAPEQAIERGPANYTAVILLVILAVLAAIAVGAYFLSHI